MPGSLEYHAVSEEVPREDSPPASRVEASPRAWVTTTYFAEGFPYTVANNLAEILFKAFGASYAMIGLTSLFHLPWNLKFLWGPFVDQHETKQRWLVAVEVLLSIVMVGLALLAPSRDLAIMATCFSVLAVLAATHDIAIDGYYLEALDQAGQSRYVGFRAMAYRVATIVVAGAGLVVVDHLGWSLGLLAMAAVMVALTAYHWIALPRPEKPRRPIGALARKVFRLRTFAAVAAIVALVIIGRALAVPQHVGSWLSGLPVVGSLSIGAWIGILFFASIVALVSLRGLLERKLRGSDYGRAYADFLAQPRVGRILAFVVLFRVGESFLMKMKWPFLDDIAHMDLDAYGIANGTVGLAASIGATMLGGMLIARHGLRRWIWPFVLGQNLLNLLYAAVAEGLLSSSTPALYAVITLERFGEGLGTAVFMVYLMRCCQPAHRAAHMAILTALMSVGFTLAGMVSGVIAEATGFGPYFALSFVATMPAMALIPLLPHLDASSQRA